ncbi:MAG: hypothetical protein A2275_12215 [Bacteroidetes bacterium RIFOXYA12_FULL_35_11]|nr:MAG: hypothetical protein A2X01_01430 [Bacteroidetes bacterium GWF2_35_48]OFY77739.1 MAG: hypothetical protein A2275_12215 [Bacteroidetes bacterium RIFOXYA12_FULL_35_11]OFY97903.1 MAG: hypothetical protein A2309_13340 [Bacteroidetes bacterium RIFOXYB2_FULL_35_7]OFY98409.1 MAG: hypothetical protein A2491_14590 [Bacteroidetes bacterium RIFOXYC12_FULL_35_7]HBX51913.1 hypothetical protein [Bacteroidales bacterium]
MERVLDVYKRPYNPDNPVVCMDESPKQLIEEGRLSTAMRPGQETRIDAVQNKRCKNKIKKTLSVNS